MGAGPAHDRPALELFVNDRAAPRFLVRVRRTQRALYVDRWFPDGNGWHEMPWGGEFWLRQIGKGVADIEPISHDEAIALMARMSA
jgi:hypothetical protein